MPQTGLIALLIAVLLGRVCIAEDSSQGFSSLFNGNSLAGWEGDANAWVVRNGAITCLGKSAKKNWLVWRGGEPGDFELRLKFKFIQGNSGVQVRSEEIDKWQVRGYQVEVAERAKMGLWHHSLKPAENRHYLSTAGQKVHISADSQKHVEQLIDAKQVRAAYRERDWNDLVILTRGPRLVQMINGGVYSELIDEDRQYSRRAGLIAFQDHGGGTEVQFKDIRLKTLGEGRKPKRAPAANSE